MTKKFKRRLRPDAIPTIFVHRPVVKMRRAPAPRCTPRPVNIQHIAADHSYSITVSKVEEIKDEDTQRRESDSEEIEDMAREERQGQVTLPSQPAASQHKASVEDFNRAKDQLGTLKEDPGNQVKLKIYALFKQATQGPCNTPKPGMLDFVNKAKRDSWKSLVSLSQEEARQQYVELISSLVGAETPAVAPQTSGGTKSFQTLLVSTENNITTIRLNRPEKKNAITVEMYNELIEALDLAGKDDSVITVMTGNGDYYCSGNDLNNFTKSPEGGVEEMAKKAGELLRRYVKAYIDFPKPLIAVINGPAVGVSVTLLGLFDVVYATERATFHTPFSQLGQSPDGCSSYLFPKIMGAAKASEMLLFNKKLTAVQACELGLVTEVFPENTFQSEVWTRLKAYAKLPRNSLALSKQLIRGLEKENLHAVNDAEVERLVECWLSDECMQAIMSFFQAKSKL